MGALAAACIDEDEPPTPLLREMMGALRHRAVNDPHMVFTDAASGRSQIGIAYANAGILPKDREQPVCFNRNMLALDGRLFQSAAKADADYCAERIGPTPTLARLQRLVLSENGMYALVTSSKGNLMAARDPLGTKPLYVGHLHSGVAIASERKALWSIGLHDPTPFRPGFLMVAKGSHVRWKRVFRLRKPRRRTISLDAAAARLEKLLRQAFSSSSCDLDKLGIAFSGGLDSAVTAALAEASQIRSELFTVGLEGSDELSHAEKVAEELGMPCHVDTHRPDEIEAYARRVLWLIEEPNLMKLSVAIPLHWTAKLAKAHGFSVLFTGQGSDELFGGYRKFANLYSSAGAKAVERAIFESVVNSHVVNFQRDEQATAALAVELRSVFCDLDVVRFGLSLPLQMKVTGPDDELRKHVLRKVAQRLGLPETVYSKRKKAIQHGTGVEKAITKLAQDHGKRIEEFLESLHLELRKTTEMP